LIVVLNNRNELFGHQRTQNRGIGNLPVWDAKIGTKWQLFRGD
jgi:hypothetical protein